MRIREENKIPFLDVMIHKQTANLTFGWYQKPNWAVQYLHYHSFVPSGWKKSSLNGLKSRLLRICSVDHLEEAVYEVYTALGNNGYPNIFIQKHFLKYEPTPINNRQVTVPRKTCLYTCPS